MLTDKSRTQQDHSCTNSNKTDQLFHYNEIRETGTSYNSKNSGVCLVC